MRKIVILLIVIVGLVGSMLVWMGADDEPRSQRHATDTEDGALDQTGMSGAQDSAANGRGDVTHVDDDPNRIDGPTVTVRGIVKFGDAGVANATVYLLPDRPWFRQSTPSWNRTLIETKQPISAVVETGADGSFELKTARRVRFVIHAQAKGHGFARKSILVPDEGDPQSVTVVLPDAETLHGIVVSADDKPVARATVTIAAGGWSQHSPVRFDVVSDEEGKFELPDLAPGSLRIQVRASGYGITTKTATLPANEPVRIVMQPSGVLYGIVMNAEGLPVPDAELRVNTRDSVTFSSGMGLGKSGADGKYRIENAAPGLIGTLELRHPKYGTMNSAIERWILPLKPINSKEPLEFNITLPAGAAVHGVTVDAQGNAVVADVTLMRQHAQYRTLSPFRYVRSDASGRFEFPHVPNGSYALEAYGPGSARIVSRWQNGQTPITLDFFVMDGATPDEQRVELTAAGSVRGSHAVGTSTIRTSVRIQGTKQALTTALDGTGQFWFPRVPVAEKLTLQAWNPNAKSKPFAVVAGKTTEVALEASVDKPFHVKVTDASDKPIKGARVMVLPTNRLKSDLRNFLNNGGWGSQSTDATGAASVAPQAWHVQQNPKGEWTVIVTMKGYLASFVGKVAMPADDQSPAIEVALEKGGVVTGRVVMENGSATNRLSMSLSPVREKGQPYESRSTVRTATDTSGAFKFEGVADGTYYVGVSHNTGKADTVKVVAGEHDVVLTVRDTLTISGTVANEDGKTLTNASIFALAPGAKGNQKRMGMIDQNGRFWIRHLDPGAYAVEVAPQTNRQNYGAPTGSFEKKRIEGVEAGRDDLVIVVSLGPALEGKVLDSNGKPAVGASILAIPVQLSKKERRNYWNASRPSANTNGRGEFKLRGVTQDEVDLLVIYPKHSLTTLRVARDTKNAVIQLPRGARIELQLIQADGDPYVGKYVNLQAKGDALKKFQDFQMRGGNAFQMRGGWSTLSGRTDAEGKVAFEGLHAGPYGVTIHDTENAMPPTSLQTGSGLRVITLEEPLTIRGKLIDADTNGPIDVGAQQVWINVTVGGTTKGARPDPNGVFEVKGLPRGEAKIQVWAGSKYRQASVQAMSGDQNVEFRLVPNKPRK